MGWENIHYIWQACIGMAWESYINKSAPIGSVIVDKDGNIISKGRNRMFDNETNNGIICNHPLAHAEMDALLKVNVVNNPEVLDYTLYTTCEPCYLCFGATIMSKIRKIEYAAKDKGGATYLIKVDNKINSKGIIAHGPVDELEPYIIALQTCYDLEWTINDHNNRFPKNPLEGSKLEYYVNYRFKEDTIGIKLAKYLFYYKILDEHRKNNSKISHVWDNLIDLYKYRISK